jgi:hypothetical protein
MDGNKTIPGDYKFNIIQIMGANYRVPTINFNTRPFKGNNDYSSKTRPDMYKDLEFKEECKVKRPASNQPRKNFTNFLSLPV